MDNNTGDVLKGYWDGDIFLGAEEFDSWGLEETLSNYYDSSSPDGPASKNIVSERNRRKKLNERLFALRAVVPNITKLDKTSIIKDAIDYIKELQEQEKLIQAEIEELENGTALKNNGGFDFEQDLPILLQSKKMKKEQLHESGRSGTSPIEILDLSVTYMGEKTMVVSLTCTKRTETMVKLCKVFETMKLKIITASMVTVSGRLTKTLFIEAEEDEKDALKHKIETSIAAFNDPLSHDHLTQVSLSLSPSL